MFFSGRTLNCHHAARTTCLKLSGQSGTRAMRDFEPRWKRDNSRNELKASLNSGETSSSPRDRKSSRRTSDTWRVQLMDTSWVTIGSPRLTWKLESFCYSLPHDVPLRFICQSSFFHSERYQEPGNAVARIAAIVAGFQQQNTDAASRVLPHLITLSSLTGWWVDTHLICLYFILLYCNNSSDNNTTNYFTCAALFILQMPQSLIKKNKQMKWENRTAAKGSSAQTNLSW